MTGEWARGVRACPVAQVVWVHTAKPPGAVWRHRDAARRRASFCWSLLDLRGGRQTALGDLLLAHQVLLHLAGDGEREAVDDADVARDLEPGDLAAAPLAQRVLVEAVARALAQHDPGAQLLAVVVVGDAD